MAPDPVCVRNLRKRELLTIIKTELTIMLKRYNLLTWPEAVEASRKILDRGHDVEIRKAVPRRDGDGRIYLVVDVVKRIVRTDRRADGQ